MDDSTKRESEASTEVPGDEVPAGMPGSGQDVCLECHGSGQLNGQPCANCGGTGIITRAIGGG